MKVLKIIWRVILGLIGVTLFFTGLDMGTVETKNIMAQTLSTSGLACMGVGILMLNATFAKL